MLQCRHNDDALLLCKPGLNNLLRLLLWFLPFDRHISTMTAPPRSFLHTWFRNQLCSGNSQMLTLHSTNVEFHRKTLAIQASPTLTNTEHYNTTRENTAKKQENHLRSYTLLGGSFLRTKADRDHSKIWSHWKLDISTTLLRSYNTSARNNNYNKQTLLQFYFLLLLQPLKDHQ
jgi:hypothetical protein